MIQEHWVSDAVFYHIFPLGFCGAENENDGLRQLENRLVKIHQWLDNLVDLGVTAIFLGPVFESSSHGYDTADYYWVDRRLGTNENLRELAYEIHRRGMRLIFDGVFNHVGRRFWAFRSLMEEGESSPYRDWFVNVRFNEQSPYGDNFRYECWEGHYNLPKLNLQNLKVTQHLLDAVGFWMSEFQIDGLRLDAADCVDPLFWIALRQFTQDRNPEFWLMGEIIHGDYRKWVNPEQFDSVTNYEAYKGLWSSLNDANYWEIAYALNRQFGEGGIYQHLSLYNFLDNHDVTRIATILKNPAHVYLANLLLFTMPGVPALYYGSESGWKARKEDGDWGLRPEVMLNDKKQDENENFKLREAIKKFIVIRKQNPVFGNGEYRQLYVSGEQFGFLRWNKNEKVIVFLNSSEHPVELPIRLPDSFFGNMVDLLNDEQLGRVGEMNFIKIPATWGRVIKVIQ